VAWEVEFTDQFEEWWESLSGSQQETLDARVSLLAEAGPALGRPTVDQVKSSRHQDMKELRTSNDSALRVLFAFDPRRAAILLMGGNKSGDWDRWYETAVPLADGLFDEHLAELEREAGTDA